LGVFEKIRGKNLLPSNPTIAYNERLVHKYGFSINKEISSYFKFSNLAEAKQVF
jgi:hypothetical protein